MHTTKQPEKQPIGRPPRDVEKHPVTFYMTRQEHEEYRWLVRLLGSTVSGVTEGLVQQWLAENARYASSIRQTIKSTKLSVVSRRLKRTKLRAKLRTAKPAKLATVS